MTAYSKSALKARIDSFFPDNTVRYITESRLREICKDIVDSYDDVGSEIIGGGTAGKFVKWISADEIGDSILSESGSVVTVAGNVNITGLTASRVVITDSLKNLSSSVVTATEIGYVNGVTSAIQTQLNAKEATITVLPLAKGGTATSTVFTQGSIVFAGASGVYSEDTNFTWTPASGLLNKKHAGIGSISTVLAESVLEIREIDSTGSLYGIHMLLEQTSTSLSSSIVGIDNKVTMSGGHVLGSVTGSINTVEFNSAVNLNSQNYGEIYYATSTASQTGTIDAFAYNLFQSPVWTGSKPSSVYGSYYQNLGYSGTSVSYALYIADQTGSTTNYGIVSLAKRNTFGVGTGTAVLNVFGEGATNSTTSFYVENNLGTAYFRFGDSGILEHRPTNAAYNFKSYQPNGTVGIQWYSDNAGNEFQILHSGTERFVFRGTGDSYINPAGTGFLGLGTTTPLDLLHLNKSGATALNIRYSNSTTVASGFQVGIDAAGVAIIGQSENFDLSLTTNNIQRLRVKSNGNVGFWGTSFADGILVAFIANATTVPTTNPTGGGILYAEAGALKWRGSSGTITVLGVA